MVEKIVKSQQGMPILLLNLVGYVASIAVFAQTTKNGPAWIPLLGTGLFILATLISCGFFANEPGGSRVLILFGSYVGTVREPGFYWVNPFMVRRKVSLRARTLNGDRLKVNDSVGNPIEIAAVVVWRVGDTYRASFDVDDYEAYVRMQSETSLRHVASLFPYDDGGAAESLRGNSEAVGEHLCTELRERLSTAGIEVMEARLSHLAYAPEIAGAMLRRQQASAVISARAMIVDGAVGMVEMALDRMEREALIKLDEERKAAMVSNLMVVLCSEHAAVPVVNSGTLYSG
jgi:regulator of protease activity HflC (stomatin/prohibitin superfamily)